MTQINKQHIVVLGSGISGLSAAANLSRKGVKVTVLEKIHQTGGFVHSFRRGKYRFEATTHQICSGGTEYLDLILDNIDVDKELFVRSKSLFETILFNGISLKIEQRVFLPSGYENIKHRLLEIFPNDHRDIHNYFDLLDKLGKDIILLKDIANHPLRNIHHIIPALFLKKGKGVFLKIGIWYFRNLIKFSSLTQDDITGKIKNEDLKWVLNTYVIYTACSPAEASGVIMSAMNFLYFKYGPYLIKGGTKSLINNMVETIEKNGGTILLNTEASKIHIENNKVKSVETKNGDVHICDGVLSAINSQDIILNMIDKKHLPQSYIESIKNVEYSTSVFQVFLGLKIDIKNYGFNSCTTILSSTKDYNSSQDYSDSVIASGRELTTSILTNYSNYDTTAAPEGHCVLCIAELMPLADWDELTPDAYKKRKEEIETALIEKVEKITGIPLKENIEVKFSGTPRTMKHYSSVPGGAMGAAKMTPDQIFKKRTQIETPIENLCLAGSSVSVTGVAATLESGVLSSNVLLKKIR